MGNQIFLDDLLGGALRSIIIVIQYSEIISSIVYLSKSLNFRVLAEYVETKEQRDALKEAGRLLYQGYLYSLAIDKEAFLGMNNQFDKERENA